jgi:hypothetical protein
MQDAEFATATMSAILQKLLRVELTWGVFFLTCRLASIPRDIHDWVPQNRQSATGKRNEKI